MQKKAVILFSSGLDSTTCVAIAKSQGFTCYALTIDYGQRHHSEVENAIKIAKHLPLEEHKIISVGLNNIGGSALTDKLIEVPDYREGEQVPVTYVPARNTVFLSMALAWAEVLGAVDIFYGANALDYSNYPDCRPEYLQAFEKLANLATKAGMEGKMTTIHAPLMRLSKKEIILKGLELGVNYAQTISCYRADSEGRACGNCDSCALRKKGFKEAGVEDPTLYY